MHCGGMVVGWIGRPSWPSPDPARLSPSAAARGPLLEAAPDPFYFRGVMAAVRFVSRTLFRPTPTAPLLPESESKKATNLKTNREAITPNSESRH